MARRNARAATLEAPRAADVTDQAFEEALERIGDLSHRLWAVRERHTPTRTWLGRVRCHGCAKQYPCDTIRAVGSPRRGAHQV